ncbi:GGDEF domain-containing protein [Novosphingobium panipatense]|jgi:diguanylate cyclase (GGDEF)-like protein|uniref:GGDEF domain-containing protein n=1 Tax=Novosphingobium TaxID=165696 RepID=UPI000CDAED97|nr:GGDEF domain-containing protein [Novosphingobium sp. HII-3]
MKFDSATLLTTAFLTLLLFGLVFITLARFSVRSGARWWVTTFFLGASGFFLMVVPAGSDSGIRILANTLFLTAYACCHAGARALGGRRPVRRSVAGGLMVWPLLILTFDPGFDDRVSICSLLVSAYSAATAYEFARGARREERSRIIAAGLCGAHALFYLVRSVLGPALGLGLLRTEATIGHWAAAVALEIVLFAAALAVLVFGATLERRGLEDRQAAYTDFLTGIGSRRAFEAAMAAFLSNTKGHDPASLVLLDLDHFKEVNDRLGHDAGDQLLRTIANVIAEQLPEPNLFWRLGGDEFALLLRGYDRERAQVMRDGLRKTVETSSRIQRAGAGSPVSISLGVAEVTEDAELADIVRSADAALYRDKTRPRAVPNVVNAA